MWKKVICFDINLMFSVLLATTSLAVEEQDIDVVQGDKVTLKCRYDSAKYLERNIYFPPAGILYGLFKGKMRLYNRTIDLLGVYFYQLI